MKTFLIAFVLFISLYENSVSCGGYNIETPPIMKNWHGYFDPQIGFYNSCGRHNNVHTGEIKYLLKDLMNFGWAFRGICSSDYKHVLMIPEESGRTDTTERKPFGTKLKDEEYTNPCICLVEVTIGTYDWDFTYYGPLVGCIPVPLPPGPPPFVEQFAPHVKVNIVPNITSTYFSPKIRAVIGISSLRECADGTKIKQGLKCSDGSSGKKFASVANTLSMGQQTINIANKNYNFKTRIEGDDICTGYYGNKEINEANLMLDKCYSIPAMPKPQNLILNKQDVYKLQFRDTLSYDIYDGNTQIKRSLECCGKKNSDSLQLIRPTINEFYELNTQYVCIDKKNNNKTKATLQADGSLICSEKQDLVSEYIDSDISNVACIIGWFPKPKEFILTRNQSNNNNTTVQKEEIVMLDNAFIPYRYVSHTNELEIDPSRTAQTIESIVAIAPDNAQSILDSINNLGQGLLSMTLPLPTGEEELIFKYAPKILKDKNTNKSTNFIYKNGDPVFLTNDEIENKKFQHYRPTEPQLLGLCSGQTLKKEIIENQDKSILNTYADCDFLRIEAWGGGAAASLDTTTSASGTSGGHTSGIINTGSQAKVISITLGKGGSAINADGEDTIVSMCDTEKRNCEPVITALGGKNNNVNSRISTVLNSSKVIFPEAFYPAAGITETANNPYPNVPLGYQNGNNVFMKFDDTECNKNYVTQQTINKPKNASGGCVSRKKNIWQSGGDGKVTVTCEQWKQSSTKSAGIEYATQHTSNAPISSNIPLNSVVVAPNKYAIPEMPPHYRIGKKKWKDLWDQVDRDIDKFLPEKRDSSVTADKVIKEVTKKVSYYVGGQIMDVVSNDFYSDQKRYYEVSQKIKGDIHKIIGDRVKNKYNDLPS